MTMPIIIGLLISMGLTVFVYFAIFHLRRSQTRKKENQPKQMEKTPKGIEEIKQQEVGQEAERTYLEGGQVADEEDRENAEEQVLENEAAGDSLPEEMPSTEEVGKSISLKLKIDRKRVEPLKRGGRSRECEQSTQRLSPQESKTCRLKPELVCWKREREWILGVEIPLEILDNPVLAVVQNGSALQKDQSKEGSWRLGQLRSNLLVTWEDGGITNEVRFSLAEQHYLLFKLSGQNLNQGRCVKCASFGSYLAIVPEDWSRDENLSGVPLWRPELISISGYRAHFFILDRDSDDKIAFLTPQGESVMVESKASLFELVGNLITDGSEVMGPLLGGEPPRIRVVDSQTWKAVQTIVVGEEGIEKGRWRESFDPLPERTEQNLPLEIERRKSGWYFIRFYDGKDNLIESLDFRFVQGLLGIKVNQPSPLPSEKGHRGVSVEFLHDSDCYIRPANESKELIDINCSDDKTILIIEPRQTLDRTRWLVGHKEGSRVEVTILVERLWWVIGDENQIPSEWKDQRLTLSSDEFVATSSRTIWVRFPKMRWKCAIFVGFQQQRRRPYTVKVTDNTLLILLRDFADSEQLTNNMQESFFKIWVEKNGNFAESILAVLPAAEAITVTEKSQSMQTKKLKEINIEKKLILNVTVMPAPRLATMLTGLRKRMSGPIRMLIKEIRREYRKKRRRDSASSLEFIKKALCTIAFALKIAEQEHRQVPHLTRRWRAQVHLAAEKFPGVLDQLRKRYEKLGIRQSP